jgi:hypothetical protein
MQRCEEGERSPSSLTITIYRGKMMKLAFTTIAILGLTTLSGCDSDPNKNLKPIDPKIGPIKEAGSAGPAPGKKAVLDTENQKAQ